jgi:hypothetical protein
MLSDNITKRLVAIQNEQQAQKAAGVLNYGQLNLPSVTPQQIWSGNVANPSGDFAASWIATFTRSDSTPLPPYVDFPWSYNLAKWYYQDQILAGSYSSASGRDLHAIDDMRFTESVYEVGSNYVSWRIDIIGLGMTGWWYDSSDGTTVTLTVQAVSMVPGTLTLVRVI